jgi:hypothetical protein
LRKIVQRRAGSIAPRVARRGARDRRARLAFAILRRGFACARADRDA